MRDITLKAIDFWLFLKEKKCIKMGRMWAQFCYIFTDLLYTRFLFH